MRKGMIILGFGIMVLLSAASTTNASVSCYVDYTGDFWDYTFTARLVVVPEVGDPLTPYVWVGAQSAKIGPDQSSTTPAGAPLYCLDLYHYQNDFSGTRYTVPPESHPQPPYNTTEAAWIYQHYGKVEANQEAVQLALWEVTHEADWYSWYNRTGAPAWYQQHTPETGESVEQFYITQANSGIISDATAILDDLYANHGDLGQFRSCYYYRPDDALAEGQGLLGDIPEPSTLMLLGGGLLASVGLAWRRRGRR